MKNFLKALIIFIYFVLCLLFKGSFEAHFANNQPIFQNPKTQIEQINIYDNASLAQNANQEITNLQNNSSNNSINLYKKNYSLNPLSKLKSSVCALFKHNSLAFNPNYIIYTRAP